MTLIHNCFVSLSGMFDCRKKNRQGRFSRDCRVLYLNTGHGTLGWTHSCGSGKSIARIVSGLAPEVDFAFTGLQARKARVGGVEVPA